MAGLITGTEIVSELWSEAIPAIAKAPITIYKKRHLLQKSWVSLLKSLGKGKTNVVMLGRSSVGKSVLSERILNENTGYSYELPGISRDVETQLIEIQKWMRFVRVIPGQNPH